MSIIRTPISTILTKPLTIRPLRPNEHATAAYNGYLGIADSNDILVGFVREDELFDARGNRFDTAS